MPRYASGDNIPQVAIQPSASPIGLNVLPAAGQPIRGANDLMQIAEAMAPFNQGLLAFGKRAVDIDNENAAVRGSTLDLAGVRASEGDLNKQFKAVIAKSGASDAANPFFQMAARQNFGRKLGFDYRAAIYAKKEQVTDPDNPLPYEQASAAAAAEIIGDSLVNDFYGFAGFREVAQKTDQEMMLAFAQEAVQRKETKGALHAKAALTSAIVHGMSDEANKVWADYQTRVTDPVKVRANFVGAAKDILMSAPDMDQLYERLDRLRAVQYGNQAVGDNMDLNTEMVQLEDQARRAILAKTEHESRLSGIAFDNAKKELFAAGFVTEAYRHIQNNGAEIAGNDIADWATTYVDDLAQRRNLGSSVSEQLKAYAIEQVQTLVARTAAMSEVKSKNASKQLISRIMEGSIQTEEQVMEEGARLGAEPSEIVAAINLRAQRSGPVQASIDQSLETATNQNAGVLINHYNANGSMPFGIDGRPTASAAIESNRHAQRITADLLVLTNQFTSGQIPDAQGKFFPDYTAQGQAQAASAVRRFIADKNTDLVKQAMDASDRATVAGKVSVGGSWIKRDEGQADSKWKPWATMGDWVRGASAGKESLDPNNIPPQVQTLFRDQINRLSEEYDVGLVSTGSIEQLRTTIAERLFTAARTGTTVAVNDQDVLGALTAALAFPGGLLAARPLTAAANGYNYWSEFKNVDAIREDYATVMRMGGLTLDHILTDRDQDGLPVFGLTLPKTREEKIKAAFSIPMIQSLDELRDVGKVSAVLRALDLTDTEIPNFIRAQEILHSVRRVGTNADRSYFTPGNTAYFATTSDQQLQEAKSAYYKALEQAKRKIGQ